MKFPHRRTQAGGDHVIAVITKYKCSSKPNVFPFVQQETGGGRFVKKTSRKYNFPHTKNNLRHYFNFLPVKVSNILKF